MCVRMRKCVCECACAFAYVCVACMHVHTLHAFACARALPRKLFSPWTLAPPTLAKLRRMRSMPFFSVCCAFSDSSCAALQEMRKVLGRVALMGLAAASQRGHMPGKGVQTPECNTPSKWQRLAGNAMQAQFELRQ